MLELHVRSISPLPSNDFQLLCFSYIGLHKLRTPELDEILTPKIIIMESKTSNLPTRKLQQVNAYMYGTRNNFKKDIRLHFNCEIYFSVHVFFTLANW